VLALPYLLQVVIWLVAGTVLGAGTRTLLVIFPLLAVACYVWRVRQART